MAELRDLVDEALGCGDLGQVTRALSAADEAGAAASAPGLAAALSSLNQYAQSLLAASGGGGGGGGADPAEPASPRGRSRSDVVDRLHASGERRRMSLSLARDAMDMATTHAPSIPEGSKLLLSGMDRRGSIVERLTQKGEEAATRLERRRSQHEQQILRDAPAMSPNSRKLVEQMSSRRGSVVDRLAHDERRRVEKIEEKRAARESHEAQQMASYFSPSISKASLEMVGERSAVERSARLASPIRRESSNMLVLSSSEIEQRRMSMSKRRPSQAAIDFMSRSEQDISNRRQGEEARAKQAEEKKRKADEVATPAFNGRKPWDNEVLPATVRCSKLPSKSSIDHKGHRSELSELEDRKNRVEPADMEPGTPVGIPGLRSDEPTPRSRRNMRVGKGDKAIADKLLRKAQDRETRLQARREQALEELSKVHTHSPRIPESSVEMLKSNDRHPKDLSELVRPLRADSHGSRQSGKNTLVLSPQELQRSSSRHYRKGFQTVATARKSIPAAAQNFLARANVDVQVRKSRISHPGDAIKAEQKTRDSLCQWEPQQVHAALRDARRERLAKLLFAARKHMVAAAYVRGGISAAQLFRQYDRDNDGELSFQEWKAALRKFGKLDPNALADGELRITFEIVDIDQDGGINLLDFRAFLRPAIQHEKQPPAVRARLEVRCAENATGEMDIEYRKQLAALKISKLLDVAREEGLDDSTLTDITAASSPRDYAIKVLVEDGYRKGKFGVRKRLGRPSKMRTNIDGFVVAEGAPLSNPHDYVRIRGGLPASVRVLCPEELSPGDLLVVTVTDGRERQVTIPADVRSGEAFEMMIDSDFALDVATDDEDDDGESTDDDPASPAGPTSQSIRAVQLREQREKREKRELQELRELRESRNSPTPTSSPSPRAPPQIPTGVAVRSLTLSPAKRYAGRAKGYSGRTPTTSTRADTAVSSDQQGLAAISKAAQIASMEVDSVLNSPVLSPQYDRRSPIFTDDGSGTGEKVHAAVQLGQNVEIFSVEQGRWIGAVVGNLHGQFVQVMYGAGAVTWVDSAAPSEFRIPHEYSDGPSGEPAVNKTSSLSPENGPLVLQEGAPVDVFSLSQDSWVAATVRTVAGDAVEVVYSSNGNSLVKWVSAQDSSVLRLPLGQVGAPVSIGMAVKIESASIGGWVDAVVRTVDQTTRELEVVYEGRSKWVSDTDVQVVTGPSASHVNTAATHPHEMIAEEEDMIEGDIPETEFVHAGASDEADAQELNTQMNEDSVEATTATAAVQLGAPNAREEEEIPAGTERIEYAQPGYEGTDVEVDAATHPPAQAAVAGEAEAEVVAPVHTIPSSRAAKVDAPESDGRKVTIAQCAPLWTCAWCTCDAKNTTAKHDGPSGPGSLCDVCGNSFLSSQHKRTEAERLKRDRLLREERNTGTLEPEPEVDDDGTGEARAGEGAIIRVKLPEGAVPGSLLSIDIGDGEEADVPVPEGAEPGNSFEVFLSELNMEPAVEESREVHTDSVATSELREWLATHQLDVYADRLLEDGYDDLQVLHALDNGEQATVAAEAGMGKEETARFQSAIRDDKAGVAQALAAIGVVPPGTDPVEIEDAAPADEVEEVEEDEEGGGGNETHAEQQVSEQDQDGEAGENAAALVVVCPEDVGPGEVIIVEDPDGNEVEIEIPEGVNPGDEFEAVTSDDDAGEPVLYFSQTEDDDEHTEVPFVEVADLVSGGTITDETKVWTEGLEEVTTISTSAALNLLPTPAH